MQIDGWDWEDHNLSHLGGRGLGRQAVLHVAQEAPKFRENLKGRAVTHQMIGPDRGGAIWVVCNRADSTRRDLASYNWLES